MARPRKPRKYDIGKTFGRLTIIGYGEDVRLCDGRPMYTYICQCECGRIITAQEHSLTFGRTLSCGHHPWNLGNYGTKNPNEYRIKGDECEMVLNDGAIALIDAKFIPLIQEYHWMHDTKHGYAITSTRGYERAKKGESRLLRLHNLIAGRKKIDHINGNPLDNRLSNLRPFECFSENSINRAVDHKNKTGYFGVYRRYNGTYCAKLQWKHQQIHLGTFKTPEEAARARDAKVLELCGGFGRLNFPEEHPDNAH